MIRKFIELSTGHLSLNTRAWLDEQGRIAAARREPFDPDCLILMGSTPHGWFVYADTEACSDPAAMMAQLDRRDTLANSVPINTEHAGAIREALADTERNLAALITPPSADIPADLWACFARANAEQCDYILFDADAPLLDGVPIFEDSVAIDDNAASAIGASA
jgi:hypothetical protein